MAPCSHGAIEQFLQSGGLDISDRTNGIEKEEANRMLITNGVMSWKNAGTTQAGG
jgi:hypothetical protein